MPSAKNPVISKRRHHMTNTCVFTPPIVSSSSRPPTTNNTTSFRIKTFTLYFFFKLSHQDGSSSPKSCVRLKITIGSNSCRTTRYLDGYFNIEVEEPETTVGTPSPLFQSPLRFFNPTHLADPFLLEEGISNAVQLLQHDSDGYD